jgi:hypothetical protein
MARTATGDRYLKHTPSGVVFIWQEVFAKNSEFVEVADSQGNPFPPPDEEKEPAPIVHDDAPKVKRGKKGAEPHPIDIDASRGLM